MQVDQKDPWYRGNDSSIIEIYHVERGEREVVAELDYLVEAPNWSKDGKELVVNGNGRILRVNLETKAVTEVPTGFVTNCNNDHVLSPDGACIAVSHGTKEDGKSRIYTVPLTGGVPRLITPLAPSYLHGWSPEGKTLAYCGERNGEYDVYAIPAEGGEEVRLTSTPGLNDGPEYSPDGDYLWFNSVSTGLMQVFQMKADGTQPRQMTFDGDWNTWFPHVSPDGKWVSMLSYKKGDLEPGEHLPHKNVVLRLMENPGAGEPGPARILTALFGGQGTLNVNSWAPDSKRFAFVSYRIRE